jgi:agmatinase
MTDPVDARLSPRFAQVASFARLPMSRDLTKARSVFVGVPWDDATSFRSGAREGPSAIRAHSRLVRSYNMFQQVYPFRVLETYDFGDIDPVPGFLEETFARVEREFRAIFAAGVLPFAAGGDHSITLPILRAQKAASGQPVNLLHFDAHFDTWESYWGDKRYTHGTWVKRAYEEGLIRPGNVFQVGIRSSLYDAADVANNARLVRRTYTIEDVAERHEAPIADEIVQELQGGPTYVSVDIDVLDPAYAPGTGTPEPGGMTSRELIHFVRALSRVDVIGLDLVEVAPQYDHYGQVTALTAANLLFEAMSSVARRRTSPTG